MFVLCLLLSGCGGGDPDNLSIAFTGSGQSPDPVVADFPIVYISRPLMVDGKPAAAEERQLDVFEPGARLILQDRAVPGAATHDLVAELAKKDGTDPAAYDVRDLSPDFDGRRLVFAMRGPFDPNANDDDQPTWNIWTYSVDTGELRRVISSDITAEAGQDRQPNFLPDGRIVFTSTRQRQSRAILLDEGRPQFAALDEDRKEPAFVLHVMNDDGTDIHQISFNQSHDQDPAVMPDGRLVFSRWDNASGTNIISLYTMAPDGTGLAPLYGYHSQDAGRDGSQIVFLNPRPLDDGRVLVLAKQNRSSAFGGDLLALDVAHFADNDQPTFDNRGDTSMGQSSPLAAVIKLTGPSPAGRYASAWPLHDDTGRLLVTWSQCRLMDPNSAGGTILPCTPDRLAQVPPLAEAAPLFGVWILDPSNGTQQPVVPPTEGRALSEAVALSPQSVPYALQSPPADQDAQSLADEGAGILRIRSVYDVDGLDTAKPNLTTMENPSVTPAASRPARFIRLVKAVSLPPRELVKLSGSAFGASQANLMREILGYTVVHPDGSVDVKVPANVPFGISVLDASGRRITERHHNWLQVRPGETLSCNGCHASTSKAPHGRRDAQAPTINPGGPFSGLAPDFIVDPGQTMAQAFAHQNGTPAPAMDVVFKDIWTDPAQRTPDPDFAFRYKDLSTPAPVNVTCQTTWRANCRINIDYPTHIHPLWSVDRRVFDTDGITVLQDRTCTSCHSSTDSMGMAQVPAAQLDLSDGPSTADPDELKSYRELMFTSNEQELVNGVLVDKMVPATDRDGNPIYQTDQNGDPLLDVNGNPIPVMTTVSVPRVLSTAGARASSAFFDLFKPGGSHAGELTPAELRLISEWLDIGGQYYNDPFKVPQ